LLKSVLVSASLMALTAVSVNGQPDPYTMQQQVALLRLPVYSSEDRQIGQVKQVRIGRDEHVHSVRVELSNSSGAEAKIVEIPADKFTRKPGRIVLLMTAAEVGELPTKD
jgi:sporulation protein YlmC with PRC-barrel domain